jgi:hypothetical protein
LPSEDFPPSRWAISAGVVFSTGDGRSKEQKGSGAVSRVAGRSAEVLRAGGGVGVEVGAAGHMWQSHICKDACSLRQARGLPSLICYEPKIEVMFLGGSPGRTFILIIRQGWRPSRKLRRRQFHRLQDQGNPFLVAGIYTKIAIFPYRRVRGSRPSRASAPISQNMNGSSLCTPYDPHAPPAKRVITRFVPQSGVQYRSRL